LCHGATVQAEAPTSAATAIGISFTDVGLRVTKKAEGQPGRDFGMSREGGKVRFFVSGNRQTSWAASLPRAVDYGRMPYVGVRYKAAGDLARTSFTLFISGGEERQWTYPLRPGSLILDGQWRLSAFKVDANWEARNITVLLGSGPGRVDLWLDRISFSAVRPTMPLGEAVPLAERATLPAGELRALPLPAATGSGATFWQKMDLTGWFPATRVVCRGIPFDVPTSPAHIPTTGMADNAPVALPLPEGTREVLLLLAPHQRLRIILHEFPHYLV